MHTQKYTKFHVQSDADGKNVPCHIKILLTDVFCCHNCGGGTTVETNFYTVTKYIKYYIIDY